MKKLTSFLSLTFCLFIISCTEEIAQVNSTPGDAATAYFDALYNQKNLHKASTMATPNLARIMKSYGTAKQFSRTLLNMQYDQVVIEVDMSNMSLREQYGDSAKINLIFTGTLNGKKIDDMRSVKMRHKKGLWYIDKIVTDPYAR